ncbi:transglycosylase domain-containing protein [Lacticaseibacillus parakribbianus]|uniref:transglycosylase domain-containing protein n=1 Tax=Lacticaseibacillus parakribbianus TaxID=2970927 RepID=UPI0021CAEFE2|nr:transglycosylase domain-containing protein [Lacticaseibacillus parakribbianus]
MKTGFKHQWAHFRGDAAPKPKKARPEPLPKLSKTTWPLYVDVTLQTLRSLLYYAIGTLIVLGALGVGVLGGYFAEIINETKVPSKAVMTRTLDNVDKATSLYFAHNVSFGHMKNDLLRETVDLDGISPWLQKALVATEDEDFYDNPGVVPKALVRAVFSDLTGLGSQTGGSTLTQQVVKLQFLSSETTFKRKAVEIMYALRLNHYYPKQKILETYLNIVTLGRNNKGQNIAGVQTAAKGLFGKGAKDLNLAQAAYIAGLPQSPSVYTPYTITGALKPKAELDIGLNRQKTVLFRMYRAGTITSKQYQEAKAYDLKADFLPRAEATSASQKYSYVYEMVTSEATTVLAQQLAKKDGHTAAELKQNTALANQYQTDAKSLLATKGYAIHSTINKAAYDGMQTVVAENKGALGQTYTTTSTDSITGKTTVSSEPVQTGAVLMNNSTGAIVSFVGGTSGQVNHINTKRSPGSSIKPTLVYGPAIENKIIGSGTMLADFPHDFGGYSVTDYGGVVQNKFVSATTALKFSYNIPTVQLYSRLRQSVDVKSYMVKNGIDTLTKNDYSQLGLALGGTDYGVTVRQAAGAFATFERGGTHVTPYVIDKIVDPLGNVVYQHKTKPNRVFSPATSYIMQQMLHEVVASGTASTVPYLVNFDTSNLIGKTGTSNDYKDVWFLASTPGMTMASWMGYDNNAGANHTLSSEGSVVNQRLWAKLVNAAYRVMPDRFDLTRQMQRPSGVKSVAVNAETGQKAGSVLYNGSTYNVGGETLTSLYNNWTPTTTQAKFAIGGTDSNYALFWEHFIGMSNGYGVKSDGKDEPKTAAEMRQAQSSTTSSADNTGDATAGNDTSGDETTTDAATADAETATQAEQASGDTGAATESGGAGTESAQSEQ